MTKLRSPLSAPSLSAADLLAAPKVKSHSHQRLRQVSSNDQICDELIDMVAEHPACEHPLFSALKNLAQKQYLVPEQFRLFRHGFFSRIFPTMLNVARLAAHALENANYHVFHTALHNLNDEGGTQVKDNALNFLQPHPVLAERAFNAIATSVFGLDNLTLKQAYDEPIWAEEITQRAVFDYAYTNEPVIASWVQERASGGNGRSQKGMLGDLFEVFAPFQSQIDKNTFQTNVVPYFSAHVQLQKTANDTYTFEFNADAVEHLHGERALTDLRDHLSHRSIDAASVFALTRSILDAQANLFDAILRDIELIDSNA